MNMRRTIMSVLLGMCFAYMPFSVHAAELKIDTPPRSDYAVGDVVSIPLHYVVSTTTEESVTLRGVLHFIPSALQLRRLSFTPAWQEVGNTQVLESHNRDGRFRFIANRRPDVATSSTHLATAEFVATEAGSTTVYFEETIQDESAQPAEYTLLIAEKENPLPTQLFDIRAAMDTEIIHPGDIPRFRLSFTSFGTVPTPIDFQVNVFNEDGEVVHYWEDALVVETEHEYTYDIPMEQYEAGYYMVIVKTKYREDVTDFFRTSFTIPVEVRAPYIYAGVSTAVLIGIGLIILGLMYRRGKRLFGVAHTA